MYVDDWDASAGGDLEVVAMHAPGVWEGYEHHGVGPKAATSTPAGSGSVSPAE